MAEQKTESMVFDDAKPWERLPREPSKSYAAFVVFRNLGPTRSLTEAHRRWKNEIIGQAAGVTPLIFGQAKAPAEVDGSGPVETGPAQNWKNWRRIWNWDERATAWDDAREKAERLRAEEEDASRYSERRRQRLLLDEIQYRRILALNTIIDNAIAPQVVGGKAVQGLDLLAKTRMEQESEGKKLIKEVDALEAFDTVCERTAELEDRYFRGAGEQLQESLEVEVNEESLEGVAEFRWTPDPEIVAAAEVMRDAQKALQERENRVIEEEKDDAE